MQKTVSFTHKTCSLSPTFDVPRLRRNWPSHLLHLILSEVVQEGEGWQNIKLLTAVRNKSQLWSATTQIHFLFYKFWLLWLMCLVIVHLTHHSLVSTMLYYVIKSRFYQNAPAWLGHNSWNMNRCSTQVRQGLVPKPSRGVLVKSWFTDVIQHRGN